MSIGKRLKKIRNDKKMTARDVSEISGVPEKTIYRIETGEVTDPKISSIKAIISALNCSANEVLFDDDDAYGNGELRKAFLQADCLPIEEQRVIADIVRRWCLVGYIETHFSKEFMSEISKVEKVRDAQD